MAINPDVTLRRLIYEFNLWADDHGMINDFGYGKYLETFRSSGRDYPVLVVNSPNATSEDWYINYSFEFICLDYVKDEKANKDRVNSDTIAIIRDLENTMRHSNRWQAFCRIDTSFNYNKVDEFGADKAFGWVATVTVKIKKRHGICDLQALMPLYDFETGTITGPTCDPATVENSDETYSVSVASGGSLVLPDNPFSVNGNAKTANPATTAKAVVIQDEGGTPLSVTDVTDKANSYVGEVAVVTPLNTANINKTGVESSMLAGDDFALSRGRGVDWYNLDFTNPWGHSKAYTGTTGGYWDESTLDYKDVNGVVTTEALAFPSGLISNWKTYDQVGAKVFTMDYNFLQTGTNSSMITSAPYTRGGFAGFYVCNKLEIDSYFKYGGDGYDWVPISFTIGSPTATWRLCTATPFGTNLVYLLNDIVVNQTAITNSYTTFVGKYLTLTDLGL